MTKIFIIAVILAALNFEGPRRLTFTSCSPTSGEAVIAEGEAMLREIRRFAYASNLEFSHESGGLYYCYKITYWV